MAGSTRTTPSSSTGSPLLAGSAIPAPASSISGIHTRTPTSIGCPWARARELRAATSSPPCLGHRRSRGKPIECASTRRWRHRRPISLRAIFNQVWSGTGRISERATRSPSHCGSADPCQVRRPFDSASSRAPSPVDCSV